MENTTKTIREWFETLPEPYRTQAIENSLTGNLNAPAENMFIALSCGFKYRRSPQGFDYWKDFQDKLIDQHYNQEQENGK